MPDTSARGRRRDDARAQALLAAALELVEELGYDKVSVDAIAVRAHSSKATLYRWWTGKADLVAEAVHQRALVSLTPPDTGSLHGDLLLAVRDMVALMASADGRLVCGLATAAAADSQLAAALHAVLEDKHAMARQLVERAVARGELPADARPEVIHEVAPAMVLHRLVFTGETLDEAFCHQLVDGVLIPALRAGPCPVAPPSAEPHLPRGPHDH